MIHVHNVIICITTCIHAMISCIVFNIIFRAVFYDLSFFWSRMRFLKGIGIGFFKASVTGRVIMILYNRNIILITKFGVWSRGESEKQKIFFVT